MEFGNGADALDETLNSLYEPPHAGDGLSNLGFADALNVPWFMNAISTALLGEKAAPDLVEQELRVELLIAQVQQVSHQLKIVSELQGHSSNSPFAAPALAKLDTLTADMLVDFMSLGIVAYLNGMAASDPVHT